MLFVLVKYNLFLLLFLKIMSAFGWVNQVFPYSFPSPTSPEAESVSQGCWDKALSMGWLNRNLLSQLWQLEAWNQGISKAVLPPKPARNPSLHLSSCWLLAVLGAPWFAAAPLPPPPLCSQDALCVISALSFIIPFLFLLWVYITLLFLTP